MKEAVFTLKLEADLRDAFMAEAEAAHRPASQIVRDFMREFVRKQQEERDYEAWELADIERGLAEANDPNTVWYDQEDLVKGRWREQRESLLARIAARDAAEEAAAAKSAK
jgi:predicted transcriptional regulator